MLQYPEIDPIALALGPIKIHWYGVMYLIGFAGAWWLGKRRAARLGWSDEQVSDLIFYGAMGVVLGGRFGYVFFYNFDRFLAEPLWLFKVWEGGMSFHGGLLGVILAMFFFAKKVNASIFTVTDFIAPMVPIGLGAGRLGNFIGGELWGRPTDLPWGMVFPHVDQLARHPSQLYQFALEGVALFVILNWLDQRRPARFVVSGVFLLCYGSFRFLMEFARQPDAHLGFIAFDWLTMGQLLSLPMLLLGLTLVIWGQRQQITDGKPSA
ncbi:phosphatidylglycerol:prolipoprotein diacylglycerol transferase [Oceanospirillum multiglobuliferum]|uniref:Phosphatidylglycerol--prolipoprotein diacylglyceryl transferase n=1 Tax=Oceanospirillum multiglobuliferum TaxID=64969 RepID=A0A1T4SGE8_9GAMM|nr:prolipoprotein diacylglyceryl transferase [Oceanospirillum multiglobuliferum]OPX54269.1 prolipoprotein diacylglyceryl transferase [Oceanospirillum multiglobuliferum]SKA27265.1 phosphatidylglycerol:prolipoprotein diacylglycerol transferase [Oceanospirillum multiglobuliferum]